MRIYGPSHKYFLMRGYAVLDNTAMPMIGDPETVYDTFVPQLVADAEAAVAKAVDMGIADPDRIGIIGHSHGGLMVANLLAHTDLFCAGIARSGSYNKTNQPYGFQGERRSLFEATQSYIDCSPTFFADKVNEPVLIIHGDDDSNPGTLTFQSEVFYEAVRGSGGTARLILLPFEDHGYRAKESIEHVLYEQMNWFDKYVKNRQDPEENRKKKQL
jgi:dipeptidyl aminopeptidase/acylaminoacyl peptidase